MANKIRTRDELAAGVRVGAAGWSYGDWNGVVYPPHRPDGFHEAAFLAQYFSVLEINASFYSPLRPEVSRVWVRKLRDAPNFEFTAKIHRGFTHERRLDAAEVRRFGQGLEPLREAGLLGCLLAQFPWSFRLNAKNLAYVARLARTFSRFPLAAEFRHASWNNSRALAALEQLGVGFCNIDQPQLSQCMPPTEHVTSPIGYVRLHGRNYQEWFAAGGPERSGAARYDYLYTGEQLAKWKLRIGNLARSTEKIYVVANNHFAGQSVANALQIQSLLRAEPVAAPPTLLERYPELGQIAVNRPSQHRLPFDRESRLGWSPWSQSQSPTMAAYAGA